MKTVFSNSEVCHVWASQSQDEGRNSKGSIFFNGRTIYSYGHHFPMARFVTADRVLVTNRSYSVTTSSHLSSVNRAIHHLQTLSVDNVEADTQREHKANLADMLETIRTAVKKHSKARSNKDAWLKTIHRTIADIKTYTSWFKCGVLPKAIKQLRDFNGDDAELFAMLGESFKAADEAEKKQQAQKRAAEKKRRLRLENEAKEVLQKWLDGESVGHNNLHLLPVRCRIVGDVVQTSHGASVPLDASLMLYNAIKTGRELPSRIGHYSPIRVTESALVVGCHSIELTELDRLHATL